MHRNPGPSTIEALREYDAAPMSRTQLTMLALADDPEALKRYRRYIEDWAVRVSRYDDKALRGISPGVISSNRHH